jgi:hypothetical protein
MERQSSGCEPLGPHAIARIHVYGLVTGKALYHIHPASHCRDDTNVGIVGIGKMGLPVALSLLEHGFAVYGYRRHMIDDFITMGGTPVSSSKEVA